MKHLLPRTFASSASAVVNIRRRLDPVGADLCRADSGFDEDPHGLCSFRTGARVPNLVRLKHEPRRLSAYPDARGAGLPAVLLDHVLLQPIAMRRHTRRLVPKVHAIRCVADDPVAAEHVVRVFVTN
jgi:hypothetical protein